jgi:hypothetical protein
LPNRKICILTDLIAGEGYKKLINENDIVYKLLIIDKLLFKKQSKIGHKWRQIVKILAFPFQVILIRKFSKEHPGAIYHAHSMYYLFLAWASGISYVGTPQGSDILIKPFRSKIYRYFTIKSLKAAKAITVDSNNMKEKVKEVSGLDAKIIQNGIDIESIKSFFYSNSHKIDIREAILSVRGWTPLYRINMIVMGRNFSLKYSNIPLAFLYPFQDNEYVSEIKSLLKPADIIFGRLERMKMYECLANSKLVISIPYSDSSPRSIYEAIFCGCSVAITYNPYFDILPRCMKDRIILVDLNDKYWFDKAIEESNKIIAKPFIPSDEASNLFDQKTSFQKMEKLLL